jgi:hypothetical protein
VIQNDLLPAASAGREQDAFFESYAWCLNPMLSLRDQLNRLQEELERVLASRSDWENRESQTNVYLFVCSIACTLDDYLHGELHDVSALHSRFGALGSLAGLARALADAVSTPFRRPKTAAVLRWRRSWGAVVDLACALLAGAGDTVRWALLARNIATLAGRKLPKELSSRRLRIPEAFRCQDLAHYDVFELVDRYLAQRAGSPGQVVVIGARTAGAYMAPLAACRLSAAGWNDVQWSTVRPRDGISRRETREVSSLVRGPRTQVVLIDDFPNTGDTHLKLLAMLYGIGVPPHQISILAPRHPHRSQWTLPEEVQRGVTIITLEPAELYKAKLLEDGRWAAAVIGKALTESGAAIRLRAGGETTSLNARLHAQLSDGYHVRLKRVFELDTAGGSGAEPVRILAKSTGWGWYGYHAYLAGRRLSGFVPEVIAFSEGFMFCRWIQCENKAPAAAGIGAYIARRANALRLDEDPALNSPGYRWVGWNEMIEVLRGLYGARWNRFRVPAIRRHLAKYVNAVRTLVDGQMKRDDWVCKGNQTLKSDFEQHNFGGPEFDLVDPAWDLAAAVFEFGMNEVTEKEMLELYAGQTGDSGIHGRIALFKLLYGAMVMKRAADALSWESTSEAMHRREKLNRTAREFLTSQMNRHAASVAGCGTRPWPWSDRVFFLDLDGVFYSARLGFPHPLPRCGAAMALLMSSGIAVVANTARDVAHVREFCRTYGIPGGLAERGSVFVDAAGARELPLIDPHSTNRLARCREILKASDDIFVDESFEFSVRACRIEGGKRLGLGRGEAERLLTEEGLEELTILEEETHTDILQRGVDKGTGIARVLAEIGVPRQNTGAIGDAESDIPMLNACGTAYAPRSGSGARLSGSGRHRMDFPAAARHFASKHGRLRLPKVPPNDPLEPLLRVAERSFVFQLLCLTLFTSL